MNAIVSAINIGGIVAAPRDYIITKLGLQYNNHRVGIFTDKIRQSTSVSGLK